MSGLLVLGRDSALRAWHVTAIIRFTWSLNANHLISLWKPRPHILDHHNSQVARALIQVGSVQVAPHATTGFYTLTLSFQSRRDVTHTSSTIGARLKC